MVSLRTTSCRSTDEQQIAIRNCASYKDLARQINDVNRPEWPSSAVTRRDEFALAFLGRTRRMLLTFSDLQTACRSLLTGTLVHLTLILAATGEEGQMYGDCPVHGVRSAGETEPDAPKERSTAVVHQARSRPTDIRRLLIEPIAQHRNSNWAVALVAVRPSHWTPHDSCPIRLLHHTRTALTGSDGLV